MTRQGKANLLGCITVGLWSTVATACKLSLGHISPADLVLYSALTSCCVLAAALIWQRKLGLLKAATGRDWLRSVQLGVLNPLCYYLVLFKAYDLLPAQQAQPLNYTWAITLSLLSVPMLGQRLVKMQLVAIVISYFGVLVISTNGNLTALHFQNPYGVFMALLSTVFWSFYWIFNTRDQRDPVLGLFMNFLCALPCIVVYILIFEGFHPVDPKGLAGAVYLGLFEMGFSYLLWLTAMKLTDSTARLVNLIFLSPFVSLIFIHFLVGETILPSTVIGLICIIFGLVLQSRSRSARAV